MQIRHCVLAFALLCSPAFAESKPDEAAARLDELIARAGLDRQLAEFQGAMQQGIQQAHAANPTLTPAQLDRLHAAIARVYTPERMRPRMRSELARMLTPADVESALAWIESPLGRKFGMLDEYSNQPAQRKRIDAALKNGAPKLGAHRAETLHALVRATQTDEFATSIVIESAIGTAEGLLHAQPSQASPVPSLRSRIEAQRSELLKQMHEQCFTIFAVAYAEASDSDLDALLGFARSSHGARFHLYAAQAFETAATQAARDLGADLMRSGSAPAKNM